MQQPKIPKILKGERCEVPGGTTWDIPAEGKSSISCHQRCHPVPELISITRSKSLRAVLKIKEVLIGLLKSMRKTKVWTLLIRNLVCLRSQQLPGLWPDFVYAQSADIWRGKEKLPGYLCIYHNHPYVWNSYQHIRTQISGSLGTQNPKLWNSGLLLHSWES